jgi:hypothetical protein
MIRIAWASLAAPALLASAAAGAEVTGVADLEGAWAGEGSFQGAASRVTAEFAPALEGAFWTLDVATHFDADGAPAVFAGRAYYRFAEGAEPEGRWFDSFGSYFALTPRVEDGAFVVDWGDAGESGRSVYRLSDDGALSIEDSVLGGAEFTVFATATLRRVGAP